MDELDALRQEALEYFGVSQFPKRVPLNTRIIWKRTFLEYEEWKIEYDVETAETMPAEAGRTVPAYLLVPRNERKRPLPAIVCFHQCALNCVIGKEAVVGKAPWSYESAAGVEVLRPQERISVNRCDQAFGYDLVHQGFVVLAPDSINCGERNIEAIRKEGQNKSCWDHIDDQLGRPWRSKALFDSMRAVDLLQSLDFVDSERMGAVGHSLGSGNVFYLMVTDPRVRAGIASAGGADVDNGKFLPLVCPRLYITVMGEFDGSPDNLARFEGWYGDARATFEANAAAENLVLLSPEMGHFFGDDPKWEAYRRLKEQFGVLPPRTVVDLGDIVREARETSKWMLEDEQKGAFPEPIVRGNCPVRVNRDEIAGALAGLFLFLSDQGRQAQLRVTVQDLQQVNVVDCGVTCERGSAREFGGSSYQTLRDVERVLAEHGTALRRSHSDRELRFKITFPKASSGA